MITFDAFLVFLGAASLPVIYLFIVSRWVEAEARRDRSASNGQEKPQNTGNLHAPQLVRHAA